MTIICHQIIPKKPLNIYVRALSFWLQKRDIFASGGKFTFDFTQNLCRQSFLLNILRICPLFLLLAPRSLKTNENCSVSKKRAPATAIVCYFVDLLHIIVSSVHYRHRSASTHSPPPFKHKEDPG